MLGVPRDVLLMQPVDRDQQDVVDLAAAGKPGRLAWPGQLARGRGQRAGRTHGERRCCRGKRRGPRHVSHTHAFLP